MSSFEWGILDTFLFAFLPCLTFLICYKLDIETTLTQEYVIVFLILMGKNVLFIVDYVKIYDYCFVFSYCLIVFRVSLVLRKVMREVVLYCK